MYIAFDGIDGCGKTIQIALLEKHLLKKNKTTLLTKEIGSSHNELCKELRQFILNDAFELDDLTAQYLLAAGSTHHAQKVLLPNLNKYDYILSDRSIYTNIAYCPIRDENFHNSVFLNHLRIFPDLVFYIDIDPKIAQERIGTRSSEHFKITGKDRIEAKGIDFQKKVRENFLKLAAANQNIIKIDGNDTIKNIQEKILWILDE